MGHETLGHHVVALHGHERGGCRGLSGDGRRKFGQQRHGDGEEGGEPGVGAGVERDEVREAERLVGVGPGAIEAQRAEVQPCGRGAQALGLCGLGHGPQRTGLVLDGVAYVP